MKKYSFSKPVRIMPWIGTQYLKGYWGTRILIVGESHYNNHKRIVGKSLSMLTKDVLVESQFDLDWKSRFLTNIAASFIGHIPDASERSGFWNSVAFYNYIQNASIPRPGTAPTHEMLSTSLEGFKNVISTLRPKLILIFSYRVWDYIFENIEAENSTKLKCLGRPQTKTIKLGNLKCRCFGIQHASRGYSSTYWNPFIHSFLGQSSSQR
jgi:hypothetical protein